MNRLARERSPYLLQHAANPVDWYPWGDDAFARARTEDKPIFLSIGYSTCHWCHVMEHESFVNGAIAEALNRSFVSIKVDREERPDVDRVYMAFVQATTGSGGWPMTVFLTPELKPFYGGTYFPPASRWGKPGFLDLVGELARVWKEDRPRVNQAAGELFDRLRLVTASRGAADASPEDDERVEIDPARPRGPELDRVGAESGERRRVHHDPALAVRGPEAQGRLQGPVDVPVSADRDGRAADPRHPRGREQHVEQLVARAHAGERHRYRGLVGNSAGSGPGVRNPPSRFSRRRRTFHGEDASGSGYSGDE